MWTAPAKCTRWDFNFCKEFFIKCFWARIYEILFSCNSNPPCLICIVRNKYFVVVVHIDRLRSEWKSCRWKSRTYCCSTGLFGEASSPRLFISEVCVASSGLHCRKEKKEEMEMESWGTRGRWEPLFRPGRKATAPEDKVKNKII